MYLLKTSVPNVTLARLNLETLIFRQYQVCTQRDSLRKLICAFERVGPKNNGSKLSLVAGRENLAPSHFGALKQQVFDVVILE